MKKLIFIFLFCSSSVYAQLNTDSLIHVLKNSSNFSITDTIPYLTESFLRYTNIDGSESFDAYLDSTGHLNQYIGLALVHKHYDKEGRITKRIGYEPNGEYYLWDYAPIVHTYYNSDTVTIDYFNNQYRLRERVSTSKDQNNRELEVLKFHSNLYLVERILNTYNDSLNLVTIQTYDGDGNFKPNKYGISIHKKYFDLVDKKTVIEEFYYDSEEKQSDADNKQLSGSELFDLKSIAS